MSPDFKSSFYVGQEVVTRREKRGTVTEVCADGETLMVRFGGKSFPMKCTSVVSAVSLDKARARANVKRDWH